MQLQRGSIYISACVHKCAEFSRYSQHWLTKLKQDITILNFHWIISVKVQNTWFRHRSFITGWRFGLPVWLQLSKSLSSAIETKTIFITLWATGYNQRQVQEAQIEQYISVLSNVTKFWTLGYLEIIKPVSLWQTVPPKLLVYLD